VPEQVTYNLPAEIVEEGRKYAAFLAAHPAEWIEQTFPQPAGIAVPKIREVCNSVRDNRHTHVKSCHNSTKTWISARILLWWLARYPGNSKVITTAPTWRQVETILWKEVADAHRISVTRFGGKLLVTQLAFAPQWFAIGISSDESQNIQGYHSPNLLIIVDEADGLDARMWGALDGIATSGNARWLCLGNPIDRNSEWRKRVDIAYTRAGQKVIQITGEDVCAVSDLDPLKYSFLLQRNWVDDMIARYGINHPYVVSKILAEWPETASDQLIPLAWIERGIGRQVARGERALFVDVGRFGTSKTVRTLMEGGWMSFSKATQREDTMQTAGRVFQDMDTHGPARTGVDDTGVGGGVTDRLRQLGKEVIGFNFGSRASDSERFANAGSEAYWLLREGFEQGTIGIDPGDPEAVEELKAQLTQPKYEMVGPRIRVDKYGLKNRSESSLDDSERTALSPDRGDSLAGAWWISRTMRPSRYVEKGIIEKDIERMWRGDRKWGDGWWA
jgi:phage terminase large subunit